jgi:hypothetical protein
MKNYTIILSRGFQKFPVNVCEILGNCFTASHFIEGHLRTVYYRSFLENEVLFYLENVPLATKDKSEYNMTKYLPILAQRF